MNHIKRLQAENAAYKKALDAVDNTARRNLAFLMSAKFSGTDSDGDRKDWMSTSDVASVLYEIIGDATRY